MLCNARMGGDRQGLRPILIRQCALQMANRLGIAEQPDRTIARRLCGRQALRLAENRRLTLLRSHLVNVNALCLQLLT